MSRHGSIVERTLPVLVGNAIDRFREGMASGVVEPRLTVVAMIAEIDAILARAPEHSLFMVAAARHLSRRVLLSDTGAVRNATLPWPRAMTVYPAYRRLRALPRR